MAIKYEEKNNVGFVVFDNPDSKVNVLTGAVLGQLDRMLDDLAGKDGLKAIIFQSNKRDCFVAGADIKEIESITDAKDGEEKAKFGQDIFNKIEDLKVPTVAVLDGVALGGGCELALACTFRLATFNPKLKIGLPEVKLGILPGFGGTYRLPRLVGLQESLGMILMSSQLDGKKAARIGLVDRLVPQANLEKFVDTFLTDIESKKIKGFKKSPIRKKGVLGFLDRNRLLGHPIVFSKARKNVLKTTKGKYPAPLKAIDVLKANLYTNRERALKIEREGFGRLCVTDVCKNCIHVFYASEKYRKLKCDDAGDLRAGPVDKCGVLGAGVMGGGIAQLLSYKGIWIRLKDISHEAIALGYKSAAKLFNDAVKRRRITKADAQRMMAMITGTLDYSGFGNCDYVIEAVVENMDVKKKVFKELSEQCSEKCIIATNTSALSVTEMAKETKDPSKVIGFHFFNPVNRMPLVEIITTPMTSKETIVTTLGLVKRLGKVPILVKDSTGFIVNRLLLLYINEAGNILEESGHMEEIDKMATGFGMPMGPFLLSDEVGLDVGVKVLHILEAAFGERFKSSEVFNKIADTDLLGKKGGKGFYIHGKKRAPNPDIPSMLGAPSKPLDVQKSIKRLVYVMINEAALCLEEGIVPEADAIDVGMIFGTGFPAFRGGLLKYADDVGITNIVSDLERFYEEYKQLQYKPCNYLLTLKQNASTFYSK